MSKLVDWVEQIRECVVAIGSESLIGVDKPSGLELSHSVTREGFPGILPLWSGRRHVVGLQADPRSSPQSWAAVVIKDRQALTLASDARTVLPQLIVLRVLSNSPEEGRKLAERWPQIKTTTFALHRALGGLEETLDTVIATVGDSDNREKFKYRKGQEAVFEMAHSTLCRKIDNSEEFRRYADWLDAAIAKRWTAPADPANYGSWGRRVLCWAHRIAFSEPDAPKLSVEMLNQIIEGNAGVDSGVPIEPSWSVQPGAASGETALVEAASVIGDGAAADPIDGGLVKALLTEDTAYSGFAHAEAAVALDERGEPERAWDVIQSAAWWMARGTEELPDAMRNGIRFLAERHNWADVLWVVKRSAAGVS